MTSYNTLAWDVDADGILVLTLNRPDQMNAFTVEMANELVDAFHRASEDDAVRAVIVTGAGRAFCAGMDLSVPGNVFGLDETQTPTLGDLHTRIDDPAIRDGVRDTGGRVTLAIYDCKKPVIAAINGAAVGIGATMTLAMIKSSRTVSLSILNSRVSGDGHLDGRIDVNSHDTGNARFLHGDAGQMLGNLHGGFVM